MLVVPIEMTFDHIKSSYKYLVVKKGYLVKKDHHPSLVQSNLIWVHGWFHTPIV
jgi:hypothetical protein